MRAVRLLAILVLVVSALACTRGSTSRRPPIHPNPNMDRQPKLLAQAESTFFYDGAAMRQPVDGTVARGKLREDEALYLGTEAGAPVSTAPVPTSETLLARGEERYEIYCTPCHGSRGNGKGIVATRGSIPAADLHLDRIVQLSDGQIFQTISNGVGLMPSLGARLPVEDRWAIVAHVRELQNR
ncbi:MAG: cytochrome c [Acidobacteriota bacterium]|nr:cytochrome c [Acidobacteriota bacterium]